MGNNPSHIEPVEKPKIVKKLPNLLTYKLPPDSTYLDTWIFEKGYPALSCGFELELVLIPYRKKIKSDFPELVELIDSIPVGSYYPNGTGKESGLIVEPRKKWARAVTLVLQNVLAKETSFRVIAANPEDEKLKNDVKVMKQNGMYYRNWTVIQDGAIDFDAWKEEWTVEIVSRVKYPFLWRWEKDAKKIWGALENYFKINTKKRGSTHVHVRQIPPVIGLVVDTSWAFAKAVAKFAIFWDPCMYLLSPQRRRIRYHSRSNLVASPKLFKLMQSCWEKGGNYKEIFDSIDTYDLPPEKSRNEIVEAMWPENLLINLMNGKQKEVAWNFLYLYNKKDAGQPARTVEYRRPAGSRSLEEAYRSITMSVVFCYGAVTRINSQMFRTMCDTPVVWEKGVTFSDDPFAPSPLPDSLVQFGHDMLSEFNKWMTEDATMFGLQDFQITKVDTELGNDGDVS